MPQTLMEALSPFEDTTWNRKLYHAGCGVRLRVNVKNGEWLLHDGHAAVGNIPQRSRDVREDLRAVLGPEARATIETARMWALYQLYQRGHAKGIWLWWPGTRRISCMDTVYALPAYEAVKGCAVVHNGRIRMLSEHALTVEFPTTQHGMLEFLSKAWTTLGTSP